MMKDFAQAIADGFNELGWTPDVPNEHNEFEFGPECHEVCTIISKINKVVESWPVVYGSNKRPLDGWNEKSYESTTHKGRLAFIEELPKKECSHEPNDLIHSKMKKTYCKFCNIELKAVWSAK